MPDSSSPSTPELWRRMEDIRSQLNEGLKQINERLDRMPTSELLTVHLRAWEGQLAAAREETRRVESTALREIKRVEDESSLGRKALHAKLETQQNEAQTSRRWAIGAAITGAGCIIAFVGLILNAAGGIS